MRKSNEELAIEAAKVGLRFIGPYEGVMIKTVYECPIHGRIYQNSNKVQ